MALTLQQANDILQQAEMLYPATEVQAALDHIASQINQQLADQFPLVLCLMSGAAVFAGQLLPKLTFPLDFDYVHGSRYGHNHQGGEMEWKVPPSHKVKDRVILALDDILDEGHTLAALRQEVMARGARQFYSAVLADKQHGRTKPLSADFVGLDLPDRFVFGYGMDVQGAWRNLPAIYAIKGK